MDQLGLDQCQSLKDLQWNKKDYIMDELNIDLNDDFVGIEMLFEHKYYGMDHM